MGLLRSRGAALVLLLSATLAAGQGPDQPAGDREPLFHLETGGPTSLVTALAFSPDGGTLYEAGWDKVVRVWRRQGPQGTFALDAAATYRVPIGPGVDGAINAMALSSDGAWLAVAGNGVVRNRSGFRQLGLMIPAPAQDDEMRQDRGLIYVFRTGGEPRNVRVLRGHLGPVLALAFAPSADGKPPLLVAAARERKEREDQGAVRLWDVDRSQPLAHEALPNPTTRPGLAAWYPGPGRERLRVAIAWGDDKLRLWDVGPGPAPRLTTVPDGLYNTTVAPFPSSPRLLTGSLHGRLGQAQLRSWDTDKAVAALQPLVMLPRPGDQIEVPSAITLVPGATCSGRDHPAARSGPEEGAERDDRGPLATHRRARHPQGPALAVEDRGLDAASAGPGGRPGGATPRRRGPSGPCHQALRTARPAPGPGGPATAPGRRGGAAPGGIREEGAGLGVVALRYGPGSRPCPRRAAGPRLGLRSGAAAPHERPGGMVALRARSDRLDSEDRTPTPRRQGCRGAARAVVGLGASGTGAGTTDPAETAAGHQRMRLAPPSAAPRGADRGDRLPGS